MSATGKEEERERGARTTTTTTTTKPPPHPPSSPYERCAAALAKLCRNPSYEGFESSPMQQVSLISASAETRSTKWALRVVPALCNMGGNLHGGAAATLLDTLTSMALVAITEKGFLDRGHVSRSLSCTYLRPAPVGDYIVESWVLEVGKRMACVRGEIRTPDGPQGDKGKVCVECVHDKAIFGPDDARQTSKAQTPPKSRL